MFREYNIILFIFLQVMFLLFCVWTGVGTADLVRPPFFVTSSAPLSWGPVTRETPWVTIFYRNYTGKLTGYIETPKTRRKTAEDQTQTQEPGTSLVKFSTRFGVSVFFTTDTMVTSQDVTMVTSQDVTMVTVANNNNTESNRSTTICVVVVMVAEVTLSAVVIFTSVCVMAKRKRHQKIHCSNLTVELLYVLTCLLNSLLAVGYILQWSNFNIPLTWLDHVLLANNITRLKASLYILYNLIKILLRLRRFVVPWILLGSDGVWLCFMVSLSYVVRGCEVRESQAWTSTCLVRNVLILVGLFGVSGLNCTWTLLKIVCGFCNSKAAVVYRKGSEKRVLSQNTVICIEKARPATAWTIVCCRTGAILSIVLQQVLSLLYVFRIFEL